MTNMEVVCFSPPGPGQCQERPVSTHHHEVPEPSTVWLFGIALLVAYLFRRQA